MVIVERIQQLHVSEVLDHPARLPRRLVVPLPLAQILVNVQVLLALVVHAACRLLGAATLQNLFQNPLLVVVAVFLLFLFLLFFVSSPGSETITRLT